MTKNLPDNVIPFPMEKIRSKEDSVKVMSYHDLTREKSADKMTDVELVFCLLNTPLSALGDSYDEKFWSRRIAFLIKVGLAVKHPDIIDVFEDVLPSDLVEFEKHRFDVCVSRKNKIVTICELKCLSGISENQLEKYNQKLVVKKSPDAPRILISLFDPNYEQVPAPWQDISLCYFAEAFKEISEVLPRNPEIANDFLNCHDFLILVDELNYRFDSAMNDFESRSSGMLKIKEMSIDTNLFKPLDRIVQQICMASSCKLLEKNDQRFFYHTGNTRGNNYFNIFTYVGGVETGVQFQNEALKLYRNSPQQTPSLNKSLSKIAKTLGSEKTFSSDKGKGFRSIRLNPSKSKLDAWSVEGSQEIIDKCNQAISLLNSINV
tara:strand:+ start:7919 stop:9049 length:1131 start_codon:yes stop_codon:yes gene_type:complete